MHSLKVLIIVCCAALLLTACEAGAQIVVPTDLPTATQTRTPAPTRTQDVNVPPTLTPVLVAEATGGPSPTPLFGATRTPVPQDFPTATRPFNPNAPRIDFFTSDPLSVPPGGDVTLFWSTRNVDSAVIYQLDSDGIRSQVFNVAPDGNLTLTAGRNQRETLRYVLGVGESVDYVEEQIAILLECPNDWFFIPSPEECPDEAPVETRIVDMNLERGRMLYVEATDTVYALFNDGVADRPAWLGFANRYDPEIHARRDENAPPQWIQPLDEMGYIWRTEGDVRSRLGLGLSEALVYDGLIQTLTRSNNREELYISGSDGVVLQLLPGNEIWQIIGGPR